MKQEFKLNQEGYEIIEAVYSTKEVNTILEITESKNLENKFGIREFLLDHPDVSNKVFTKKTDGDYREGFSKM